MKEFNFCICGENSIKNGLCEECQRLLRAKTSKSINVIEKFRSDYNNQHNTYMSYGQFVLMIDLIYRRKKESDNRRKKAVVKKIRGNRR